MPERSIQHKDLLHSLSSASISISPAEVQAVLCGLLCAGYHDAEQLWLTELMPEGCDEGNLLLSECHQQLRQLFRETLEAFDGPGVGFSLLLPDEGTSRQMAQEVLAWCHGFLYGLGLAKAPLESLSDESKEGLNDLTEITRMDVDSLQGSEEEEVDITELSEFIWVVAMLVREELVHRPKGE